jgi:ubiquinone/menaquinone biosynthesis C-methylase UbiE
MVDRYMHRTSVILVCIVLLFLLTPVLNCMGQQRHDAPGAHHSFDDIEKWITLFEDPERDTWQKPAEVIRALNLKSGDVIADIGAGTGYFTRRFAVAVGPEGSALGLDVEPAMIEHMREDARKRNLENYLPRLVKPDDPQLEPQSVDVIFICNTLHHIEDRVAYLTRLSSSLKKDGRIIVVDFYKKPLPVGPSPVMKLTEEEVIGEFLQAGYRLKSKPDFLPYQYFLEFVLQPL